MSSLKKVSLKTVTCQNVQQSINTDTTALYASSTLCSTTFKKCKPPITYMSTGTHFSPIESRIIPHRPPSPVEVKYSPVGHYPMKKSIWIKLTTNGRLLVNNSVAHENVVDYNVTSMLSEYNTSINVVVQHSDKTWSLLKIECFGDVVKTTAVFNFNNETKIQNIARVFVGYSSDSYIICANNTISRWLVNMTSKKLEKESHVKVYESLDDIVTVDDTLVNIIVGFTGRRVSVLYPDSPRSTTSLKGAFVMYDTNGAPSIGVDSRYVNDIKVINEDMSLNIVELKESTVLYDIFGKNRRVICKPGSKSPSGITCHGLYLNSYLILSRGMDVFMVNVMSAPIMTTCSNVVMTNYTSFNDITTMSKFAHVKLIDNGKDIQISACDTFADLVKNENILVTAFGDVAELNSKTGVLEMDNVPDSNFTVCFTEPPRVWSSNNGEDVRRDNTKTKTVSDQYCKGIDPSGMKFKNIDKRVVTLHINNLKLEGRDISGNVISTWNDIFRTNDVYTRTNYVYIRDNEDIFVKHGLMPLDNNTNVEYLVSNMCHLKDCVSTGYDINSIPKSWTFGVITEFDKFVNIDNKWYIAKSYFFKLLGTPHDVESSSFDMIENIKKNDTSRRITVRCIQGNKSQTECHVNTADFSMYWEYNAVFPEGSKYWSSVQFPSGIATCNRRIVADNVILTNNVVLERRSDVVVHFKRRGKTLKFDIYKNGAHIGECGTSVFNVSSDNVFITFDSAVNKFIIRPSVGVINTLVSSVKPPNVSNMWLVTSGKLISAVYNPGVVIETKFDTSLLSKDTIGLEFDPETTAWNEIGEVDSYFNGIIPYTF